MKLILILFLFSLPVFAKLSDQEKAYLRKLSMEFCSCRQGTYAIYFDTEKPLANVFCRNGENRVFWTSDKFKSCKK